MATKDTSSGLLSKVVKFVRHPTTDWAELDKGKSEPAGTAGKQAFKDMLLRKRHNDSVRQREFDQLRKLRRTSPVVPRDQIENTSLFRGSTDYSDLDERAMTLKKIDEIEAQMSKQWWKGRPTAAPAQARPAESGPDNFRRTAAPKEASTGSDNQSTFATTQLSDLVDGMDDAPTQMGVPSGSDFLAPGHAPADTSAAPRSVFSDAGSSAFRMSSLLSVDMGEGHSDPELEEAAIRFANADDAGAEAALRTALQRSDVSLESSEAWAGALLDFYRCTGQQANFERSAIEYAQRFGRSAPAWFSTPQQLGLRAGGAQRPSSGGVNKGRKNAWVCPAELTEVDVARLRELVSPSAGSWCLDWRALRSISSAAAPGLADLFVQWCTQALRLQIEGAEHLQQVLQGYTPTGDNQVDEGWWRLRLECLRVLHLPDEFDLVALDYCVTYEVSPPSWQEVRCERVMTSQPDAADVMTDNPPEEANLVSLNQAVRLVSGAASGSQIELCGEVLGDIFNALTPLQQAAQHDGVLTVSCARLIRVDFSAAGSILNWAANVESQGGRIDFRDVPRLVAAFFNLIGINEHARIMARFN
ncbi:STAS domain-containing protein [Rhodoferax sp.]|uniref:STAS domain-containing protein n=1 Tax=Rhodoferax sp. TaxID=50421 RepID=UPI00261AFD40|nr:STAS domain-containing protein [Rhodoferax sp.]MDD2923536.1 STAS domain-containing protein [Rhodoferax sp.]